MFTGIKYLFCKLLGIGETYIKGRDSISKAKLNLELTDLNSKTKISEARAESANKIVELENSETFNMDKASIDQMKQDWKDDAFALFFFFLLFGSFVPALVPHIKTGLQVLSSFPDFILYGLGLIFVHVFGFRNLLRLILRRRGVLPKVVS